MSDDMVEVFQDAEYGEAAPPCSLFTDSLGPCIGIGVIDYGARVGYLVHVAGLAVSSSADDFFGALGCCSQNVRIVIAGGDDSWDASGETAVGQDRKEALKRLADIFPGQAPETYWSPPNQSMWIKVDPGAGTICWGLD